LQGIDNREVLRRVYAYAAYRLGDGPDAEDATSATVERALRYRGGFDPSRGDLLPWLLGIARRCVADQLRERGGADHPEQAGTTAGPEELAPDRLDLRRALALLGGRERELIALRYGADLTAREIADVMGMRPNTVEVALHRALRALRDELDDERVARLTGRAGEP
jgi:RNA polymerase sigma-70 factor (ECF subfamily)